MTPAVVTSLVLWVRAVEQLPPDEKMTLYKLFVTAFVESYKIINPAIILGDLRMFAEKDVVPEYVVNFLHKQVYKRLVYVNPAPKPRIIL